MSLAKRIAVIDYRLPIALCCLFFAFFLYRSVEYPIHDFTNSYFPAKFFSAGQFDKNIFDPYTFNKKIAEETKGVFANFSPNPPSVALFFLPFTVASATTAKLIFNIFSICIFLLGVYRICKHIGVPVQWAYLVLPLIFFIPLRNNVLFGQTYLLIFSLLVEGFIAFDKKSWTSSIWWSIAIFLKVFPVIIFLFLIIKKEYKQAGILLGVCTLLLLVFVGLQGAEVWKYYFLKILPRSSSGDLHAAYTTATQSAHMLFKFLFVPDEIFNKSPLIDSPISFLILSAIFSSLILSFTIDVIKKSENKWLGFSLLIFCTQLLSPQSSSYSIILLGMVLLALDNAIPTKKYIALLLLALVIAIIPISLFQSLPLLFRFPRLLLMLLFFGMILWTSNAKINIGWFVALLLIFAIPSIAGFTKQTDKSVRLIDTEKNPLIIDYGVLDHKLYYWYWTAQGEKNQFTNITIDSLSSLSVKIQSNQIFYGDTQLTNSSDNKKNAAIINSTEIIYLSDKGKGIGFYAIRKIAAP